MKLIFALALMALVAACGADGDPIPPTQNAQVWPD